MSLISWAESTKHEKRVRNTSARVALRRDQALLEMTMSTWTDATGRDRHSNIALMRIAERTGMAEMERVLRAWSDSTVHQKKLKHVSTVIASKRRKYAVAPTFLAWVDHVAWCNQARACMTYLMERQGRCTEWHALCAWSRMARIRSKLKVSAKEQSKATKALFFCAWRDLVLWVERAVRASKRLRIIRERSVIAQWQEAVILAKRNRHMIDVIGGRVNQAVMWSALSNWSENVWEVKRARHVIDAVKCRVTAREVSCAFGMWRETVGEVKRARHVIDAVVLRMRKRVECEAFVRWIETAWESKNCCKIIRNVRSRLNRRLCHRVLGSWTDFMLWMRRAAETSARIDDEHMRHAFECWIQGYRTSANGTRAQQIARLRVLRAVMCSWAELAGDSAMLLRDVARSIRRLLSRVMVEWNVVVYQEASRRRSVFLPRQPTKTNCTKQIT